MLAHYLRIVHAEDFSDRHRHPFFVTDDPVLFEALCPQYDGCLYSGGELDECDFGVVQQTTLRIPSFL
jgi:hypothetical protein